MAVVVVFNQDGARILKNPKNYAELALRPDVLIDPDMTSVKHVPPHLWCIKDGKLAVKADDSTPSVPRVEKAKLKLKLLGLVLLGAVIGYLIGKL